MIFLFAVPPPPCVCVVATETPPRRTEAAGVGAAPMVRSPRRLTGEVLDVPAAGGVPRATGRGPARSLCACRLSSAVGSGRRRGRSAPRTRGHYERRRAGIRDRGARGALLSLACQRNVFSFSLCEKGCRDRLGGVAETARAGKGTLCHGGFFLPSPPLPSPRRGDNKAQLSLVRRCPAVPRRGGSAGCAECASSFDRVSCARILAVWGIAERALAVPSALPSPTELRDDPGGLMGTGRLERTRATHARAPAVDQLGHARGQAHSRQPGLLACLPACLPGRSYTSLPLRCLRKHARRNRERAPCNFPTPPPPPSPPQAHALPEAWMRRNYKHTTDSSADADADAAAAPETQPRFPRLLALTTARLRRPSSCSALALVSWPPSHSLAASHTTRYRMKLLFLPSSRQKQLSLSQRARSQPCHPRGLPRRPDRVVGALSILRHKTSGPGPMRLAVLLYLSLCAGTAAAAGRKRPSASRRFPVWAVGDARLGGQAIYHNGPSHGQSECAVRARAPYVHPSIPPGEKKRRDEESPI